jgi:hypothetical protein
MTSKVSREYLYSDLVNVFRLIQILPDMPAVILLWFRRLVRSLWQSLAELH